MGEDTTIRLKHDTWRRLRERKGPGDTFDGVLNDVLDKVEEHEGEQIVK